MIQYNAGTCQGNFVNSSKNKEKYLLKWLDFREGYKEGVIGEFDNALPEVTGWSPKKKQTPSDNYLNSKKYKYFQKLKEEAGGCSLCGGKLNLVVDHCHSSRKIRGILCQNCNHGLGKFKDDTLLMEKAIEYLKKDYSKSLDYYTLK